jgi:hypothetical protein
MREQKAGIVTALEELVAIREWLARIGENDPSTVTQVLDQCRDDPEAGAYFLRRAKGLPC